MRLIATDVDGTILPSGGRVSARTAAALTAATEAGVDVVLVTGRPPRWLGEVVADTGLAGVAICANGAVLVDLGRLDDEDHGVLDVHPLPPALVLEVAERLRAEVPGVVFGVETSTHFAAEAGFPVPADLPTVQRGELADLVTGHGVVVKLLGLVPPVGEPSAPVVRRAGGRRGVLSGDVLSGDALPGDRLLSRARLVLADLPVEPVHSGWRVPLVEVGPPGVDKASSLARLAADRGIAAADVVAFGDMPNDVAMLLWAGRGFAMADGHPEAQAVADAIVPSVAEDGVATVVEELLAARTEAAS